MSCDSTGKPSTGKPSTGKPSSGKPSSGKPSSGKPSCGTGFCASSANRASSAWSSEPTFPLKATWALWGLANRILWSQISACPICTIQGPKG
ncbi:MAG: hypothetical protein DWH99_18190 [Planctomycetota bacterium]|nr:MAG: hypothetical protein DWH99_18190 [Planctomycetota bacterium]